MITIALDAMGGDHAPGVPVRAVNQAVHLFPNAYFKLFGDEEMIRRELIPHERIEVIHTDEVILGDDDPVKAVRTKRNASMVLAARAVKEHQADVLLSAGNTGGLLTAGLLIVGRIKNIDRPGLAPVIPTISEQSPIFILMDAGANADTKPINIQQFAVMASVYAEKVLKIPNPRVGLVNNGTEPTKGSHLSKEAYQLLTELPNINFVGNVESKELLNGVVDIAVTDGFTGNVILKTLEGTSKSLLKLLKKTLTESGWSTKIGAALIKKTLKKSFEKLDDSKHGGAILLGVQAPVIKAHGSADEEAIINAIKQSIYVVESESINIITEHFKN